MNGTSSGPFPQTDTDRRQRQSYRIPLSNTPHPPDLPPLSPCHFWDLFWLLYLFSTCLGMFLLVIFQFYCGLFGSWRLVSFILQAVAEISVGGASSISAIWLYKMINRWTGAAGGGQGRQRANSGASRQLVARAPWSLGRRPASYSLVSLFFFHPLIVSLLSMLQVLALPCLNRTARDWSLVSINSTPTSISCKTVLCFVSDCLTRKTDSVMVIFSCLLDILDGKIRWKK